MPSPVTCKERASRDNNNHSTKKLDDNSPETVLSSPSSSLQYTINTSTIVTHQQHKKTTRLPVHQNTTNTTTTTTANTPTHQRTTNKTAKTAKTQSTLFSRPLPPSARDARRQRLKKRHPVGRGGEAHQTFYGSGPFLLEAGD